MIGPEGKTTQIDHLVISDYGIFVIETKNYYGWISGNEYGNWLLTIYKFKRSISNPLSQNLMHIKALQNLLWYYPSLPFYSIVVFTKRSIFKVNTKKVIVYYSDLLVTIKKYQKEIIPDDLKNKLFQDLLNSNIKERRIREDHVARIKENKKDNRNKIKNDICPKCGGLLVIRDGEYGKFKGCRNFPKCKFTANL